MSNSGRREIVERFAVPFEVEGPYPADDPRHHMRDLLAEGRYEAVIEQYDVARPDLPTDPRLLLFLTAAYVQRGAAGLGRASELANAATTTTTVGTSTAFRATAFAYRAALARRTGTPAEAEALLRRALEADPTCRMAWHNRLCYASKDQDLVRLQEVLEDLEQRFPGWSRDHFLGRRLLVDNDLAWARRQPCFSPFMRESESVSETGVESASTQP